MKKLRLLLFNIIFILALFVPGKVLAVDLTVTCTGVGPCSMSPTEGATLFNETNWLPGDSVERLVTVVNQDADDACNLTLDTKNETQTPADFATSLFTSLDHGSTNLFNSNLNTLFNQGQISLGMVGVGATEVFDWSVDFDINAGNEFQNAETVFDFDMVFACGIPSESTPAPGPSVFGFASPGAPDCNNTAPSLAPVLTAAPAGTNSVLLSWTSVTPVTRYMIRYGVSPGDYIYGAADIGNVTSFLVQGLSGGTTYYFQVAAVNGCQPGPWSNEESPTPAGNVLPLGPAEGFIEQQLGVSTEATPIPSPERTEEVKGLEASPCGTRFPWWIPLVLQLIFTGLYLFIRRRETSLRRVLFIPAVFAVLSYIAHLIIGCPCENRYWIDKWCSWYWLLDLVIVVGGLIIYKIYKLLLQRNPKEKK